MRLHARHSLHMRAAPSVCKRKYTCQCTPVHVNPQSHSLHTGGVADSIPASPTIFPKWFQSLKGRPLPLPPLFDLEQNLKDVSKLGEISGSKFAIRSTHLQRAPGRREARLSAPSALNLPVQPRSRGIGAQSRTPSASTFGACRHLRRWGEPTSRTDRWIEFGIGGQKAVKVDGRCRQISNQE